MTRSEGRSFFAWAGVRIALAFALLLSMQSAFSAQPISLDSRLIRASMFGAMEFVEDPSQQLSLEQVRALPASRFAEVTKQNFMVGFNGSAFWMRARLHNRDTVPVEWVVKQHLPITDFVEYWVIVGDKIATSAIGGDRTRLSERQVPYRYPVIKHTSQPGESAELYIRLHNINVAYVLLLFELSAGRQFVEGMASEQVKLGVLYGMPLALAFMALIGWIVTRDRRFSMYALYALSVLGSWLGLNGLLVEYVFVDAPNLSNNALHVFFLLAIIFSAMFSRDFLRTRALLPWCDRYFQLLIWASVACIVLRVAGVYTFVTKAANVLVILDAATPIVGWLALRRGVSYARWYLIAQLFYSTMIVVGVMLAQLTYYAFGGFIYAEVAFFGQLLLLSVAQYDRMRVLQRDKERAEQHYQEELKIQVAERTRDLEEAREKADRASRSKSEFLANMSHEIRTPINAVAGFTALALRTELTDKQADYLEKIRTATQGLSRIIDDLLDFSKIEAGHLNMEHTPFRLDDVIDTTVGYVKPLLDAKGLKWMLDVAPDVPMQWIGDPLRLGQVLTNLCSNAVKFTERGEVELRVTLVSKERDRARLQFAVRDTGIGLTPEQSGKLFQAFTQADTSTTRKFGGTGLGLVISQRLVSMMNGHIWLDSAIGVGTTFYFEVELELCNTAVKSVAQTGQITMQMETSEKKAETLKLEEERQADAPPQPELEELLAQFNAALVALNTGLEPLRKPENQHASSDAVDDRDLIDRMQPLLQELRVCLQQNDTRAENIVAEMQKLAGEKQPAWLAQVADAVNALEYETALARLRDIENRVGA